MIITSEIDKENMNIVQEQHPNSAIHLYRGFLEPVGVLPKELFQAGSVPKYWDGSVVFMWYRKHNKAIEKLGNIEVIN